MPYDGNPSFHVRSKGNYDSASNFHKKTDLQIRPTPGFAAQSLALLITDIQKITTGIKQRKTRGGTESTRPRAGVALHGSDLERFPK